MRLIDLNQSRLRSSNFRFGSISDIRVETRASYGSTAKRRTTIDERWQQRDIGASTFSFALPAKPQGPEYFPLKLAFMSCH
jgi:hypothetical protein